MNRKSKHLEDDPVVRSGEGLGLTFAEVVGRRMSRRAFLGAGLASAAAFAAGGLLKFELPQGDSPTGLDFVPLEPNAAGEGVLVAPNYTVQTLARWGDPLKPGLAPFDPEALTPARQAASVGYNCDFVGFLPLPRQSENSDHGLLAVNFEYVNPELMFDVADPKDLSQQQAAVCLEAVGFGVMEVIKRDGKWEVVENSRFNKRHSATSPMRLSGPAAGDARMRTSAHPDGRTCTGTLANCSAGKTPWGTVLSGEENFQDCFGGASALTGADLRSAKRYGLAEKESEYALERHFDRFDAAKEPNEPYHFGWVVEFDPYDPEWTPVKRTALGRFRHEAATTWVTKGGRVVMYSGDDARFEYVYKFVCAKPYNPADREANRNLLDEGTLYVAKFLEDGKGVWLPLVHGQGPLTAENGFASQADVVIDARIAADLLGATKMDRPEDIEVNPVNQKVYVVCTNNVDRGVGGKPGPDKANPRSANKHGHIIEIAEAGGDHAATEFEWNLFLVCGDPADEATYYAGFPKNKVSPISCPDNICFDAKGNLWIATDGQEKSLKLRDGFYAVPTSGPERGNLKRFMATVPGSEVCGPEFTPDGRTAFLAIQHPGEGSTYRDPSTRWPDGKGAPRPSIVAIQAKNGGPIGSRGA